MADRQVDLPPALEVHLFIIPIVLTVVVPVNVPGTPVQHVADDVKTILHFCVGEAKEGRKKRVLWCTDVVMEITDKGHSVGGFFGQLWGLNPKWFVARLGDGVDVPEMMRRVRCLVDHSATFPAMLATDVRISESNTGSFIHAWVDTGVDEDEAGKKSYQRGFTPSTF